MSRSENTPVEFDTHSTNVGTSCKQINFSFPSVSSDILESIHSLEDQVRQLQNSLVEIKQSQEKTTKRVNIIHSLFNEYKCEKDTVYDFLNKQLGKINLEMMNEQKISLLEGKVQDIEKCIALVSEISTTSTYLDRS